MRIARFVHSGGMSFGAVEGEQGAGNAGMTVAEIEGHPFGDLTFSGSRWALDDVRMLSPILPSKVVCVGRNYAAHAAELGNDVPEEPLIFLKPNTSVIGPGDQVLYPPQSQRVDYEGELAVVIGRICRDVTPERVPDVVYGYTVGNDVTARDLQRGDVQFTRAKGFDSFCPLGPWIETE
ncbi:MAG TPA: fumarylacetoacetate hydrolase family protein, partial [Micromonosporaceae bacterium]|nr:fumarylacetoacetate hydrolase family protein [Micromonosporaceae bacterium]